ncbi:MAG: hypothetical protein Hals2KO_02540 [Halioglobus sp.]
MIRPIEKMPNLANVKTLKPAWLLGCITSITIPTYITIYKIYPPPYE